MLTQPKKEIGACLNFRVHGCQEQSAPQTVEPFQGLVPFEHFNLSLIT